MFADTERKLIRSKYPQLDLTKVIDSLSEVPFQVQVHSIRETYNHVFA